MTVVTAELMGYNKRFMWIRVPYLFAYRVLTLKRGILKHGFATAQEIDVEIDYDTLRTEGRYYVADVELLSVRTTRANKAVDPA